MTLYEFLAYAYLERGAAIKSIRTRRPVGVHERGNAPQHACEIWIEPIAADDTRVALKLDNCPSDEDVESVVEELGGVISRQKDCTSFRLTIGMKDSPSLNRLAKAIRALIGRNCAYSNRNWRWVCPKTATAMTGLARRVREFRSSC